jgi:cytochrome c-type biogenesis protein CcmE
MTIHTDDNAPINGDGDSDDLAPRQPPAIGKRRSRNRKWAPIALLVLVVAAGGVMVTKFLTSSVDYYCNVDEIGTKSGCDVGRNIRLQGEVVEGTVHDNGDGSTDFTLAFNGRSIPVDFHGVPGGLFQECINVVVSGRAIDGRFDGTSMAVKHSNEYEAKNAARVSEGEDPACSQRA